MRRSRGPIMSTVSDCRGVRKRRQRQCKVCSILKRHVGERHVIKYYCATCSSSDKARMYLCEQIWPHHYSGTSMTCSQIWHFKWEHGPNVQTHDAGGT
ncbi:Hypothetical protein PHPALM_17337 [Phytophthora palmivora]|uniref:PiggyBac transposable element-derived protein 4 C-terminal zinc-ribbon domain-containing protein n=1 Tax=Phytophthora palmivora TaxID=4796 RepID=A0A2P4XMG5_9STRA|nr:Hypothetical protein PHPALM_17337 [Phytophthora palmivora]